MIGGIAQIDVAEIGDAAGLAALTRECRPVVVRGVGDDWPLYAAAQASADEALTYLSERDAGLTAEYFSAPIALDGRYHYGENPGSFNFSRKVLEVREALERIRHNASVPLETGYVGSLPADSYFPAFAAQNPCALLADGVRPRLWLGNRSTTACHYDSYDNLACVVAGRRRFTLYPPEAIGDLYIGPIDHTLSGQPVSMAAGLDDVDGRYPRFAEARAKACVVELGPGEALYLPKLWWHQVEALDPVNILVNYWWDGLSAGPDSPYAALLLAMIAIAERPAPERAAWRAYFDHYAFRPDGHPLAHLPETQHGVLGPLAEGHYGRIRTLVMRMLRGA
jgi:hypothetical protein